MSKPLWLALAAAPVLWFVLSRATGSSTAPEAAAPSPEPSQQETRTQADVESLRASLARAERRIVQLETAKPQPAESTPAADEPAADKSAAPAGFTNEERSAHVAQVFDAERPDPSWAGESEARSLYRQLLPAGSTLRSVDCRRSMCRVETSHPNAEARQAYVTALAMPNPQRTLPFGAMLFDEVDQAADREQRSVVYLVRAGHELPNP